MGRRKDQSALAKGWTNLDSLTWREKVQLAQEAEDGLRSGAEATLAVEVLAGLMRDPQWQVRKAVADRMDALPDHRFPEFAGLLLDDSTAFVAHAAKRSVDQRQRGLRAATRRRVESQKVADGFARFAKCYGADAAAEAKALGERWCEEAIKTIVHESLNNLASVGLTLQSIGKQLSRTDAVQRDVAASGATIEFLQRLMYDMQEYFAGLTVDRTQEYLAGIVEDALCRARCELETALPTAGAVPVDLDIPESLTILVSRSLFVASLKNLIKNAIEAVLDASEGGGRVSVQAREQDGAVRISVSDDGAGMSGDKLEQLQRFVPGVTTKQNRGTGFGLPLVKRYIEQHDGEVLIDSSVNLGTTVTLVLPQETE